MADVPRTIGPYTLLHPLGFALLGDTWRGMDSRTGQNVVVRFIQPELLQDPSRFAAMQARAQDLLAIKHPYLVKVLDWMPQGPHPILVEEAVDGVDLRAILSQTRWSHDRHGGQVLDMAVFLHLATQICNGLEALHGRTGRGTGVDSVLHLGLRPTSVFVSREGKVILGGFALLRSPMALGQTGPKEQEAHYGYLAPEQTHPDQRLTPATDVFTLGTVLYELLTGRPLFRADTGLKTIQMVRRADVADAMLMVSAVLPGLDKVLFRALALNARHRYQRAFVLREDLRAFMAGYSFANITEACVALVEPLLAGDHTQPELVPDDSSEGWEDEDAPTRAPLRPSADAPTALEDNNSASVEVSFDDDEEPAPAPPPPAPEPEQPSQSLVEAGPEEPEPGTGHYETLVAPDELPVDLNSEDISVEVLPDEVSAEPVEEPPPQRAASGANKLNAAAWLLSGAPPTQRPSKAKGRGKAPPRPPVSPSSTWPPNASDPPPEPKRGRGAPPVVERVSSRSRVSKHAPPPAADATWAPEEAPRPIPPPAPMPDEISAILAERPGAKHPEPDQAPTVPPSAPEDYVAPTAPPPRARAPLPLQEAPRRPSLDQLAQDQNPSPWDEALADTGGAPQAEAREARTPPRKERERKPAPVWAVLLLSAVTLITVIIAVVLVINKSRLPDPERPTEMATRSPPPVPVEPPPEPAAEAAAPEVPLDGLDALADAQPAEVPPAPELAPAAAPQQPAPQPAQVASAPMLVGKTTPPPTPSEPKQASRPVSSTPPPNNTRPSTPQTTQKTSPATPTTVPAPGTTTGLAPVATAPALDLNRLMGLASKGQLGPADLSALSAVPKGSADYSTARSVMLSDAEKRGDSRAARAYLDDLLAVPENRYNSVYLAKDATWLVNQKRYAEALDRANNAERHWARIPPDLVYATKRDIYEAQASAYLGLFYQSPEDTALLDSAIRSWERYRQHVSARGDAALVKKADTQLARLQDMRGRLP